MKVVPLPLVQDDKKSPTVPVGVISDRYKIARNRRGTITVPIYDQRIHTWIGAKARWWIGHGFDCPVLIAGRRRRGKSTNAVGIGLQVDPDPDKKPDDKLPLEYVCFRLDEFRETLREVGSADPKHGYFPVAIYDEAGVDCYSKDWNKRFVKKMVKVFEIIGKKRITMIFCLPHRNLLTGDLRESMQYWISVKTVGGERGFAELRENSENENIWKLQAYWNPLCGFSFNELEGDYWRRYEMRKDLFIDDYEAEGEDVAAPLSKTREQRDRLLRYIMSRVDHPNQLELAEISGLSNGRISEVLKAPSPSTPT